ncbi:MAG: indole-3-glycerol phosphate synthase TrpC [Acidobacteria bacterium]|nr:indole-3-glycerol phosphate synthase TrpC [Acidobacteriota bacterium]
MATVLDKILAETRRTVAARKSGADLKDLDRRAAKHTPRGFAFALKAKAQHGPAVIAELKKASPSKGVIRVEFDPASLAKTLEAAGAAVLSVLTDEPFFQGSLRNLEIASESVKIPCLRKDFMVDEFQMLEARAHGADAILLIAAALTDAELKTLRASAKSHGLDVLCEVHDAEELARVRDLGCEAYGVNSRNLKTFEVSLDLAEQLAAELPRDAVRVAESGIHSAADIERMQRAGYEAFLVGESLMRQPDPGTALRELLQPAVAKV